jgi:hypothetical protein
LPALFGCLHLYERAAAVLALAALGILYGRGAHRMKGDLRGLIIARTLQDFLDACLALTRPFLKPPRHHP